MIDLGIDTILFIVPMFARIALTDDASPLFKVCSVLANGPLTWAVPVSKNRLICNDLTKQTNISIHCLPVMVLYCIRWCRPNTELADRLDHVSWIVYPLVFCWFWQVTYLIITEVQQRNVL